MTRLRTAALAALLLTLPAWPASRSPYAVAQAVPKAEKPDKAADPPKAVDAPAPPTFAELDKAAATIKAFNAELEKRGQPPLEIGRPGPPGPPGRDGAVGPAPAHRWDGTKLQFQNPDGTWGPLVDLKGGNVDPPTPPVPTPTGKVSRFVVVEDTTKAGGWRGTVLGSPKVAAFYRSLQGERTSLIHRLVDINADGTDPVAVAYRKLAATKPSLPWLWLLDDKGASLKDLACPIEPDAFIAAFDLAPVKRAMGLKFGKPRLAWTEFGSTPNTPLIPRANWKPVDLAVFLPPVHDQDGIGQCASSSACTVLEACRRQAGLPYVFLSAGDLYGRVNGGRDEGSMLEDNLAELMNNGVAQVSADAPYLWRRGQASPASARQPHRVVEAYLCTSFDAMASAIQQGFLIQHGLMWFDNFEPDANGWLPSRGRGQAGGHALCGYGIAQKTDGTWGIMTRNSWGSSWGKAGNCIIPESLFDSTIGGFWAVRAVVQTPDANFPAPPLSMRKTDARPSFVLAP